jgi:hypothetical protein
LSYYWIADRQGRIFQRLNELYANYGQVGFLATQRVDGKLTLAEAVQVLKMKEYSRKAARVYGRLQNTCGSAFAGGES